MTNLLALVEIEEDKKELRELGLTDEEVEGCIEFFIENYLGLGEYYGLVGKFKQVSASMVLY